MKQTGKTWTTADGQPTLARYIPSHERLFEKLGQKIATEAVIIENRLREAKAEFIAFCKEAYRNQPGNALAQRRFSFTTFDKEFKIEYDIKEEYVRVYRATRKNPTSKDYELINLDFNKAVIGEEVIKLKPESYERESIIPAAEEMLPPKGLLEQLSGADDTEGERGSLHSGEN